MEIKKSKGCREIDRIKENLRGRDRTGRKERMKGNESKTESTHVNKSFRGATETLPERKQILKCERRCREDEMMEGTR